ncbi:MAG: serine/threonine-protein kinase [Planctomycetota bacterium]
MRPEEFRRVQECFLAAAELPESQRAAFLDAQCEGDADLRAAVEDLLAQDADPLRLSGAVAMRSRLANLYQDGQPAGERPTSPQATADRPDSIHNYRILGKIGEGGFGTVYKAEQVSPVERTVAIKVIKLGMDSRQVVARFNLEFAALGKMKHPHIAHFLEAGHTEAGQPYFVMEYVDGAPVHEFCDARRLAVRERIALIVKVCGAIHHAHTKAVIHRDIKPSNVLVEGGPHGPTPKVIDFGIAKAISGEDDAGASLTQQGQVIGTPAYMSPEQVAAYGEKDIDTRSDVYSLGVVLYELLTGTVPFESGKAGRPGILEYERLVREVDPPRPSLCVHASAVLDRVAAERGTAPSSLYRMLRGDLDWIVMKAIEKAPERRYQSAQALADDLGRYLADEPVEARPPTTLYLLRKFGRRHRGALIASALIVALLAGGIVATAIGWARADEEGAIAEAVQRFLTDDLLASVSPEAQGFAVSMASVLDTAAKSIDAKFADQPRVEIAVRLAIGRTYRALGRLTDAQPHLARAHRLAVDTLGDAHPDTLDVALELSRWNLWQGRNVEAERLARGAFEGRRRIFGLHHADTVEALTELAAAEMERGRLDEARTLFQQAKDLAIEIAGLENELAIAPMHGLAHVTSEAESKRKESRAETTALFERVLALSRAVHGDDHPSTLRRMNDLAFRLESTGRADEAEPLYLEVSRRQERIQGRHHPGTMTTLLNVARLYGIRGRLDEAAELLEELRAAGRENNRDHDPGFFLPAIDLAKVRAEQGRHDEAATILDEEQQRLHHLADDSLPIRRIAGAKSWLQAYRSQAKPNRESAPDDHK